MFGGIDIQQKVDVQKVDVFGYKGEVPTKFFL